MKTTLTLAAAALLASVSFAAAQGQQPAESGQKAERNPSGAVGGSEQNPSPTMMKDRVTGPKDSQPAESGQKAERNPSGATIGSEKNPSPRTTTGSAVSGPRDQQSAESGQKAERNPSGRTGGSEKNPSPR